MKKRFETIGHDPKPERFSVDPQVEARIRLVRARLVEEQAACSPRAALALSALSGCRWLREKISDLAGRIRLRRSKAPVSKKADSTTHIVNSVVHLCAGLVLFSFLCSALGAQQAGSSPAPANASCSDQAIRDAVRDHTYTCADDCFFWSGAFDRPRIGKASGEQASTKMKAEGPMKNSVVADQPQRVVVSQSGDMAYEYGTGNVAFDDRKSGQHTTFQTGYLRVWKVVDGRCEVEASMIRPFEDTWKTK